MCPNIGHFPNIRPFLQIHTADEVRLQAIHFGMQVSLRVFYSIYSGRVRPE
jgi:hypothetical protein